MLARIFIKMFFVNNQFVGRRVNVLSMPVINTVIASMDMRHQDYLRYERGSDCPNHLHPSFRKGDHYELVEITYRTDCPTDSYTPPSSPEDLSTKSRKRRHVATTTTTTTPTKMTSPRSSAVKKHFQKELSWCILNNVRSLSQLGSRNSRYCYIDTHSGLSMVSASNDTLFELSLAQPSSGGNVCGYMKLFSHTARAAHLSSLNYRNGLNLCNYLIIYFDIERYFQLNSENIFHLSSALQLNSIATSMSYETKTEEDAAEKLRRIEHILHKEVTCEEVTE